MPTAPPTACLCGGKRTNGTCDRCGPRKDTRRSSSERGYGPAWDRAKDAYLRTHPVCVCCEAQGVVTGTRGRAGLRVDHIVPKRLAPERFWDETNYQTLCLDCDLRHKQPLEKRCSRAEQVEQGWQAIMDGLRHEAEQRRNAYLSVGSNH